MPWVTELMHIAYEIVVPGWSSKTIVLPESERYALELIDAAHWVFHTDFLEA